METEFIPYKLALELKELGFDIPSVSGYSYPDSDNLLTQAILYQQAFRWFREKHNINTVVSWRDDLLNYDISLTEMKKYGYFFYKENFKTYEEAELACLNKLIEIVKTK